MGPTSSLRNYCTKNATAAELATWIAVPMHGDAMLHSFGDGKGVLKFSQTGCRNGPKNLTFQVGSFRTSIRSSSMIAIAAYLAVLTASIP